MLPKHVYIYAFQKDETNEETTVKCLHYEWREEKKKTVPGF